MGKKDCFRQKMPNVIIPDNDQSAIEVVSFDHHPQESAQHEVVQQNGHSSTCVWLTGLVDSRQEDDENSQQRQTEPNHDWWLSLLFESSETVWIWSWAQNLHSRLKRRSKLAAEHMKDTQCHVHERRHTHTHTQLRNISRSKPAQGLKQGASTVFLMSRISKGKNEPADEKGGGGG